MKTISRKTITEQRLINGFFREALFHSRVFQIEGGGFSSEAIVTDVDELTSHDKTSDRFVTVTFRDTNNRPVKFAQPFNMRCSFPHFVAVWNGVLAPLGDGQFNTPIPKAIEIYDARDGRRHDTLSKYIQNAAVLLETGGLHFEGLLSLQNFSKTGYGGQLRVASNIPLNTNTIVSGVIQSKGGHLQIKGRIAQAQLEQSSSSSPASSLYRVGIESLFNSKRSGRDIAKERRAYERFKSELAIQLVSPLNPNSVIDLKVSDVSMTGFLGVLVNKADHHLLPFGCGVTLTNPSLIAELVSVDNHGYRFQITSGSPKNRLEWVKLITKFQFPNTSTRVSNGTELIDLFCESGAFSAKYLRNSKGIAAELQEGFVSGISDRPWMHRWVERTDDGKIKGHISAIQFADNLWHLGDIAGMAQEGRKLSLNFIPKFFSSFREFALSASPCPQILIGWAHGHPFWNKWESYLKQPTVANSIFRYNTSYYRSPNTNEASAFSDWTTNEILPSQYSKIRAILKSVDDSLQALLTSLDFNSNTFSSPTLTECLRASEHPFTRQYVLFSKNNFTYLAIFQRFPLGSSPNRTLDVPWLIPVTPVPETKIDDSLLSAVRAFGLTNSFTFPGILEVRTSSAEGGNKSMIWTLAHPDVLEFFRETP